MKSNQYESQFLKRNGVSVIGIVPFTVARDTKATVDNLGGTVALTLVICASKRKPGAIKDEMQPEFLLIGVGGFMQPKELDAAIEKCSKLLTRQPFEAHNLLILELNKLGFTNDLNSASIDINRYAFTMLEYTQQPNESIGLFTKAVVEKTFKSLMPQVKNRTSPDNEQIAEFNF